MNLLRKYGQLPLLVVATMLCTVGCKSNQDQVAANSGQNGTQDSASDPAAANLAPVSADSSAQAPQQYSNQQSAPLQVGYNSQESAPPPNAGGNYSQPADQPEEDSGYG